MTTTSDAQFLAPSVAKTERGGGHSSKVKVLPKTPQVNAILDTKGKTKASHQRWFAHHTLPVRGYFILFISFDEASFAR